MIKLTRPRRAEDTLVRKVVQILEAADFKIVDRHLVILGAYRRPFWGDMLAVRMELGRERRYNIKCVTEINGPMATTYFGRYRNYIRQDKQPFADFDEFWLVGHQYTDDILKVRPEDRHFRLFDLEQLRNILASRQPRRGSGAQNARTRIGKAVEANEAEINLAVSGLILQIDDKVALLRGHRPNHPDEIARQETRISEYERMRAELEHIQAMIAAFKKGEENEAKVVKSVKTFAEGVRSWWNKGHGVIVTKTFDMGLFATSVGICSMAGAGGKMSVAVSAVLVGGRPLATALKGLLPKKFPGD